MGKSQVKGRVSQPDARALKKQLREAVANYMSSEGCSCCRGYEHDANAAVLAKLLSVKKFSDGSGYDFYSHRTKD
ncbi:MAG: hypothetical protein V4615_04980 [Bacteroidota bacterium]